MGANQAQSFSERLFKLAHAHLITAVRSSRREPEPKPTRGIQVKHADRRSTDCGSACDPQPVPGKMLIPLLSSRIEQTHNRAGLRIDAGKVAPFVKIAVGTCHSEVVEFAAAAMLSRDDVLDVKCNQWGVSV